MAGTGFLQTGYGSFDVSNFDLLTVQDAPPLPSTLEPNQQIPGTLAPATGLGSELFSDPGFNISSGGPWTLGSGVTINSTTHMLDLVGAAEFFRQQVTLVNGQLYRFSVDVIGKNFGPSTKFRLNLSATSGADIVYTTPAVIPDGDSTVAFDFTSDQSGSVWVMLEADSQEYQGSLDNASLKAYGAGGGGTTYDDNLTETLTAADSLAALFTANPALSEGLTAADSNAAAVTFVSPVTEGLTAGDAYTGGLLFGVTLSEGLTAADSVSSTIAYNPTLSEGLTAADSYAALATINATRSEGLTAADTYGAAATFIASLSEGLTAADSSFGGFSFGVTLSEGLTAADSVVLTSLVFGPSLTESLTAADALTSTASLTVPLTESLTAADAYGAAATIRPSITEGLTAADVLTGGLLLTATVSEGLTASFAISPNLVIAVARTETLTAGDSLIYALTFGPSLTETLVPTDDYVYDYIPGSASSEFVVTARSRLRIGITRSRVRIATWRRHMEILEWATKPPGDAMECGIDFAKALAPGDSLATMSYSFVVQAGLSKSLERIDGTIARVRIAGGTDGLVGKLLCSATTTLGESLTEDVIMRIQA